MEGFQKDLAIRTQYPSRIHDDFAIELAVADYIWVFNADPNTTLDDVKLVLKLSEPSPPLIAAGSAFSKSSGPRTSKDCTCSPNVRACRCELLTDVAGGSLSTRPQSVSGDAS